MFLMAENKCNNLLLKIKGKNKKHACKSKQNNLKSQWIHLVVGPKSNKQV